MLIYTVLVGLHCVDGDGQIHVVLDGVIYVDIVDVVEDNVMEKVVVS